MLTRVLLIALVALLTNSCGGGYKYLPSSNPPEYDPKKIYTSPALPPAAPPQSAMSPAKPASQGATIPVPCKRPPNKKSDLDEPPIVCGGGSGGLGGAGGSGGGGGGQQGGRRSASAAVLRPSYVLEFQSMIMSTDPDGDPAQSRASAMIQLNLQDEGKSGAEAKYTGEGHIAYRTGPLPNWEPCTALVRGEGTVGLRVFQAFIHVEEQSNGNVGSGRSTAKIELLYGILGASQETSTGMPFYLEGNCVPNKPQWHPFWSANYISGRGEVTTMPEQMFLLKDWTQVGQNGVVAMKTLNSTCGGMCTKEVVTFTLKEADSSEATPTR